MIGSRAKERPRTARRFVRVAKPTVRCDAGRVLDLSQSGARIEAAERSPRLGSIERVSFSCSGLEVRVSARVAWVERSGLFRQGREFGVQFLDLDPVMAEALVEFACNGGIGRGKFRRRWDGRLERNGDWEGAGSAPKADVPPPGPGRRADFDPVTFPDLYALFGLARGASDEQLKSAYRRLAKELHPDHNPDPDAAERFEELSKAYRLLKDPELRRRYDERYAELRGGPVVTDAA